MKSTANPPKSNINCINPCNQLTPNFTNGSITSSPIAFTPIQPLSTSIQATANNSDNNSTIVSPLKSEELPSPTTILNPSPRDSANDVIATSNSSLHTKVSSTPSQLPQSFSPTLPSLNVNLKNKILQVMATTKVDKDTASVTLFKSKDNVNDAILKLLPSTPTVHTHNDDTTTLTTKPFLTSSPSSSISTLQSCANLDTKHSSIEIVHDSGASGHYVREIDEPYVCNVRPALGPPVTLPDSTITHPTKTSIIPLSSDLSLKAQRANVLPALKSSTLVSAGQLCDDGCDVVFRKQQVHALKDPSAMDKFLSSQKRLITGNRN